MSKADEMRKKIAELDRLRRWSREAEVARGSIRLLMPVRIRWRDRALGFIRSFTDGQYEALSPAITGALYEALGVVRDRYDRQAAELEQEIEGQANE